MPKIRQKVDRRKKIRFFREKSISKSSALINFPFARLYVTILCSKTIYIKYSSFKNNINLMVLFK